MEVEEAWTSVTVEWGGKMMKLNFGYYIKIQKFTVTRFRNIKIENAIAFCV